MRVFDDLKNKWCGIFKDECSFVRVTMEQSHDTHCHVLQFYAPEYFVNIPCQRIPPFNDLFRFVQHALWYQAQLGSLKKPYFHHENIYDEVYFLPSLAKGTKCFHTNNSIELIDISYTWNYGYPERAKAIELDIT